MRVTNALCAKESEQVKAMTISFSKEDVHSMDLCKAVMEKLLDRPVANSIIIKRALAELVKTYLAETIAGLGNDKDGKAFIREEINKLYLASGQKKKK